MSSGHPSKQQYNSKELLVRSAVTADYKIIQAILDQQFGLNYLCSKNHLKDYPIALVAIAQEKIVGFCAGKIENNIGILDLVVVIPSHQKKGIGTALFKVRMEQFQQLKIQQFKLYHWAKKQNPTPWIALKNGFIPIKEFTNYWANESLQLNYNCSVCGPPPCTCKCVLYVNRQSKNNNLLTQN